MSLSSSGHLFSPVVFDDINLKFRPYGATLAYAQSKTAANLFAVAASTRWHDDGITVNTANPGAIATLLQRHVGGRLATPVELQKTPNKARRPPCCRPSRRCWTASVGDTSTTTRKPWPPTAVPQTSSTLRGVAPYSLDPGNAERLWSVSAAPVGLQETGRQ